MAKKDDPSATYAAMRARVNEQIDRDRATDASIADPAYEAPRCVLGHITDGDTCARCEAQKGAPR